MHLDPIRLLLTTACLSLMSCPTQKDDTSPAETEDTAPTFHPNVPDQYKYTWDTNGCDDGSASVYHLAAGTSDGTNLTVDEQWFWFFGHQDTADKPDYTDDCIDTVRFEGAATDNTWQAGYDPCSQCEEEYTGTYETTDSQCGFGDYGWFFIDDWNGYLTLLLDTLTPDGLTVNQNTLVIAASYDEDDMYTWDMNYALGHVTPDTKDDWGGPSSYMWVNGTGLCIGVSGG